MGVGALWVVWHLPLYFVEGSYQHGVGFASVRFWLGSLALVQLGVLYVWLVNGTGGSILIAILAHSGLNISGELVPSSTTRDAVAFLVITATTLGVLGERAGMSRQPPYLHFPGGTPQLLAAIAIAGFERLAAEIEETVGRPGRPRLLEQGIRYVRFAVLNPGLYRAMYSPLIPVGEQRALSRDDGTAGEERNCREAGNQLEATSWSSCQVGLPPSSPRSGAGARDGAIVPLRIRHVRRAGRAAVPVRGRGTGHPARGPAGSRAYSCSRSTCPVTAPPSTTNSVPVE